MIQRGFHNKLILKMIINQATQDWQNAARNAESVIKAHELENLVEKSSQLNYVSSRAKAPPVKMDGN